MPLRRLYRRMPLLWQLTAALCIAVLIIAGLVVSIIANSRAGQVGDCVNGVLGDRASVTQKDSIAHVDFAQALQQVLLAPKDKQPAEYAKFLGELHAYVDTLAADQAYRDAHPLGKC